MRILEPQASSAEVVLQTNSNKKVKMVRFYPAKDKGPIVKVQVFETTPKDAKLKLEYNHYEYKGNFVAYSDLEKYLIPVGTSMSQVKASKTTAGKTKPKEFSQIDWASTLTDDQYNTAHKAIVKLVKERSDKTLAALRKMDLTDIMVEYNVTEAEIEKLKLT